MNKNIGFSLIELVISLCIIALLIGGSLTLVSSIYKHNKLQQDEILLNSIKESLFGFAITNGRLPCPAENENSLNTENCNLTHGILPSTLLGITKTDRFGNPISYYVNSAFSKPLEGDEICSFNLTTGDNNDDEVRKKGNVFMDISQNDKLASGLAAIIVLHNARGKNSTNNNEQENSNNDDNFVSQPETQFFDDKVEWISPYQLKYKMLEAGKLP